MEDLIYGKNKIQHIVGLEIESTHAVVFTEKDGQVSSQEIPHKYWMLCNEKLGIDWIRLDGDQHYKFGKQYDHYWKLRADKEKFAHKDLYMITNPTEALLVKDGLTYYKGLKPEEVSILCFDIETTGVTHDDNSKVLLIANTLRINGQVYRKLFAYDDYSSDGEMIASWCNWVQEVDPSIICGHNIYGFDLPYLKFVASKYDYDLLLGRDGSKAKFSNFEAKFRVDGSRDLHYHKVNIYGRELCDTMFLAYKYDIGRKYESYGLKPIIKQENLEKLDRVFYDAGTIKDNYLNPEEWTKIKAYAIDDGDDALSLFDLMAPVMFYLCNVVPKPFQLIVESASGSQINSVMVRAYLQNKHSIAKPTEVQDFQGAISFAVPNIYFNMLKIDFSALYPSIMRQYEVYDSVKDPNKYFCKLVEYFAENRQLYKQKYKETKEKKYDDLQNMAKVIANSCYGFLSASGLNYNSPEQAAFITAKGRELLSFTIEWATGKTTDYWMDLFKEKTK